MPVKAKAKPKSPKRKKTESNRNSKSSLPARQTGKTRMKKNARSVEKAQVVNRIAAPRVEERRSARVVRNIPQFSFMKAPGNIHDFQVGKKVEVFCDHDKSRERVRGWIEGVIVQVDNKMVAVQFRSNVYLTDGWMVPDRILWYPLNSEHVRPVGGKSVKKEKVIPDY